MSLRNYRKGDEPIPAYRLQELLGQGSFGQVWKALGPGEVEVALKLIRGLDGRYAIREWQSLQEVMNLKHSNLVEIYGVWLKDENGKVLNKSEILALIPPEPEHHKSSSATTKTSSTPGGIGPIPKAGSQAAPAARPSGWNGSGGRSSSTPVDFAATLAPTADIAVANPNATTKRSDSAGADAAGSGDQGSMSSASSGSKGSAGSGGSGSATGFSPAKLIAANVKIPPLELVIAMTMGQCTLMDQLKEARASTGGGIPKPLLIGYMQDAAKAIQFLNERNIQHCDIKPENLMVVGGSVRVCDYGSALKSIYDEEARTHQGMTREYAAPEQMTGRRIKVHRATDQYALAMTYYALRTGKYPWKDDAEEPIEVIKHQEHYDFTELQKLTRWPFEINVLKKALKKEPKHRYAAVTDFVADLEAAFRMELEAKDAARRRFQRKMIAAMFLLVAVGLGVSGWVYREDVKTIADRLIHGKSIREQIEERLADKSPKQEAFLAAVDALKKGLASKKKMTPAQAESIRSILSNKLMARFEEAAKSPAAQRHAAITSALEVYTAIPDEFRTRALRDKMLVIEDARPLPAALEAEITARLGNQEFAPALAALRSDKTVKEGRGERRILTAWLDHAGGLAAAEEGSDQVLTGLETFLEIRRQFPKFASEVDAHFASVIGAKLSAASDLLNSATADNWMRAKEKYSVVRVFLEGDGKALLTVPEGAAFNGLPAKAALGELAAEARLAGDLPAASSQLNERLTRLNQVAPEDKVRYDLLLVWHADLLSKVSNWEVAALMSEESLDAMIRLKAEHPQMQDWEQQKFVDFQRDLIDVLAKDPNRVTDSVKNKAGQINDGAELQIALSKLQKALQAKPSPDAAQVAQALAEANAAPPAKDGTEKAGRARLQALTFWWQLANPGNPPALTQSELTEGLRVFAGLPNAVSIAGDFCDTVYVFALGESGRPLQIVDALQSVRTDHNRSLVLLLESQARAARVRQLIQAMPPDWKVLQDDALWLAQNFKELEDLAQSTPTVSQRSRIMIDAALLEASAFLEPIPNANPQIERAYSRLATWLNEHTAGDGSCEGEAAPSAATPATIPADIDRDYLVYARDLARLTWDLPTPAGIPANPNADTEPPFAMVASASELLQAPHRRRRAAREILNWIDSRGPKYAIPTDADFTSLPEKQNMDAVVAWLEHALSWGGDVIPQEQVEIHARLVRAIAYSQHHDWQRIHALMPQLLTDPQRKIWQNENVLGQLYLVGANAYAKAEQSVKDDRRSSVVCYAGVIKQAADPFRPVDEFPDLDLYQRVIQPALTMIESLQAEATDSDDALRSAIATVYGYQGILLERDHFGAIATSVLNTEVDSLDAQKARRTAFANAAAWEPDSDRKRKAQWYVGEARSLMALRDNADDDVRMQEVAEVVAKAMDFDDSYHGGYAVLGSLAIRKAIESLDTDQALAKRELEAARTTLVKARELVQNCPEQERSLFEPEYLERLSSACVGEAFLYKPTDLKATQALLTKAYDYAVEAKSSWSDDERSDPANAYFAIGNALEDFALHRVAKESERNDYFDRAIVQFQQAAEINRRRGNARFALAQFNLGRCQFRYAWLGMLDGQARLAMFAAAEGTLRDAEARQTEIKNMDGAAETNYFLAQIAYQRTQWMLKEPELAQAELADKLQKGYLDAVKHCATAVKLTSDSTRRNLSLYEYERISYAYFAGLAFRDIRRSNPPAAANMDYWRDVVVESAEAFLRLPAADTKAATTYHKANVLEILWRTEAWDLPPTPSTQDTAALAQRHVQIVDEFLDSFPADKAGALRARVLMLPLSSPFKDEKNKDRYLGWIADLRNTVKNSDDFDQAKEIFYTAQADAFQGILELSALKSPVDPKAYTKAMDLIVLAARGPSAALEAHQGPRTAAVEQLQQTWEEAIGYLFNKTDDYLRVLAANPAKQKEYLTWLTREYDKLRGKKSTQLAADARRFKARLATLR